MKNINIIFCRIWPYIQLNYSYASLQCMYDGDIAAVATKLIPCQIGIVASIYEIMRQWSSHIMMHLEQGKLL